MRSPAKRSASLFGPPSLEDRASWVHVTPGEPKLIEVPRSASTDYLTHGLFRYVGKLPPPLVAHFLAKYTTKGDLVLDPMAGGGTTAIEAASSGRLSLNYDINPVALLLTEALTAPTDLATLTAFAAQVMSSAKHESPPAHLEGYFGAEAYGLISTGLRLATTNVERALMLSIVRRASNANTKKINTVIDPAKIAPNPRRLFEEWVGRFVAAFESLADTAPASASVIKGSATSMDGCVSESVAFALLHPPYLTNTAFSEVTQLQLQLLGYKPETLRDAELAYRGSYFHVPNGLKRYLLGWAAILRRTHEVLTQGGIACVVIGDGRIDHVRIPIGAITAEFASDLGFKLVERYEHVLNNQTGWTLSRRMLGQHVLLLEK